MIATSLQIRSAPPTCSCGLVLQFAGDVRCENCFTEQMAVLKPDRDSIERESTDYAATVTAGLDDEIAGVRKLREQRQAERNRRRLDTKLANEQARRADAEAKLLALQADAAKSLADLQRQLQAAQEQLAQAQSMNVLEVARLDIIARRRGFTFR